METMNGLCIHDDGDGTATARLCEAWPQEIAFLVTVWHSSLCAIIFIVLQPSVHYMRHRACRRLDPPLSFLFPVLHLAASRFVHGLATKIQILHLSVASVWPICVDPDTALESACCPPCQVIKENRT